MATDYKILVKQAESLIKDCPHKIANLANISALIYDSLTDINWAGFYLLENDKLVLGPFQGKVACIEIPVGKGVCGTAIKEDKTQLVPDVHQFPGHIACDSASESEIVIPIHSGAKPIAVLDIDSPIKNRFDENDKNGLEKVRDLLETYVFK